MNPIITTYQITERKSAHPSRRSLAKRARIATLSAIIVAAGTFNAAQATVYSGHRPAPLAIASLDNQEKSLEVNEFEGRLFAVAPTIALTAIQSTAKYEFEPVTITAGFARTQSTLSTEWTKSASGTDEYYYNGTLSALSSNTMYNTRAYIVSTKSRSGTLGSLAVGAAAVGDNDTLGADTIYIRKYDAIAPANYEIVIVWDETDIGSNYFSRCECEWYADRTDTGTVDVLAAWESRWRYTTDPRTGNQIDLAGQAPTSSTGSPVRGPCITLPGLPAGTSIWKLRITNEAGLSTTASITITTGSTARTNNKTVKASGGDYTSLLTAVNAAATGWKITVEGGHTEDLGGGKLNLSNHEGVLVEWDGVGTKPIITTTDKVWDWSNGHGNMVWGIDGNPNGIATGPYAQISKSNSTGFVNCDWNGDATNYFQDGVKSSIFGASANMFGVCVMNCTNGYVKTYPYGSLSQSNGRFLIDSFIIGNDFQGYDGVGPSNNESGMRDASSFTSWCILYNKLSEDSKSAIRQTNMDHSLIYGNSFGPGGDILCGQQGSAFHLAFNVRIDSNYIDRTNSTTANASIFKLAAGIVGATICNNVVSISQSYNALAGSASPGVDTTYYAGYRQHKDIWFVHNTVIVLSAAGNIDILKLTGATTSTYVSGCQAEQNVLVTFTGHTGNDIVGSTGWTSASNTTGEDSLDSDYRPTTITPTVSTTHTGVMYDYWGNVRSASSSDGASTGAAPTPPPTPQLTSSTPADNATGVDAGFGTQELVFDKDMKIGVGDFRLYQTSPLTLVYTVPSGSVTINILDKTQVTIPSVPSLANGDHHWLWDQGVLTDTTGIALAENTDSTKLNFTVGSQSFRSARINASAIAIGIGFD